MLAKIQLTNRNKRMATHFNIMKTSKSRYPPQQTRPRPDTPARDRLDHRPGCTPSSPDTEPILSDLSADVCKCNFMENERGRSEVTKKIRTFAEIILDL